MPSTRQIEHWVAGLAITVLGACDPFSARELSEGSGGAGGGSGAAGAGGGAGVSGDCPQGDFCNQYPGAHWCDDFESGARDPGRWPVLNQEFNSTAVVDADRPHCGGYSLHTEISAVPGGPENSGASFEGYKTLPSSFSVRLWVYVPSPLPNESVSFATLVNANGPGAQLNFKDTLELTSWADTPTINDRGTRAFPSDRWTCVEWKLSPGMTEIWLDGRQELARAMTTPEFSVISVGGAYYQASGAPALSVYIDDLTITTDSLGCPLAP